MFELPKPGLKHSKSQFVQEALDPKNSFSYEETNSVSSISNIKLEEADKVGQINHMQSNNEFLHKLRDLG